MTIFSQAIDSSCWHARRPGTTAPLCPLLEQEDASPRRDPCARGPGVAVWIIGSCESCDQGSSIHDGRHHFGLQPRLTSVFKKKKWGWEHVLTIHLAQTLKLLLLAAWFVPLCRAIVEVLPKDKGSTTDLLVEFHVEDSLTLGESTSLWAGMFCSVALLSVEENKGPKLSPGRLGVKLRMEDGVMGLRWPFATWEFLNVESSRYSFPYHVKWICVHIKICHKEVLSQEMPCRCFLKV